MQYIILVAIVSCIAMYLVYRPLCGYVRGYQGGTMAGQTGKGKRRKTVPAIQPEASNAAELAIGKSVFTAVMVGGLLIRLIAAAVYRGHDGDMNCFISWADMVFDNGIGKFYSLDAFTDYPPGYMYILYVIGAIRSVFGIAQTSVLSNVLTKLPAILCDMGMAWLIYRIARKHIRETGAAILSGIYLITPAILLDSAIWGQVDSVFTLCIVLMCYLITEKKLIPAYFLFAAGILIKPQSLIFTPVLLFAIVEQIFIQSFREDERSVFYKKFWKNLGCGILAILMIGLFMLPFGFEQALSQYTQTVGSYPYASVNAYNFWVMIGKNWVAQSHKLFGVTYQVWGTLGIIASVIFTGIIHFRGKDFKSKYYFSAAMLLTGVFTLSVRMHERYLYPAVVMLLLCYVVRPRKKIFFGYAFMSLVCFCNMAHTMVFYDAEDFKRKAQFPMFVGALMVAVLCYMVYLAITLYAGYRSEQDEAVCIQADLKEPRQKKAREGSQVIHPSDNLGKMLKLDFICMGVITLVYAVIAFSNLGSRSAPTTEYSFAKQGEVVLDFGQQVQIMKIWDYLGYQNNPKYVVSYSDNPEQGWADLFTETNPLDAGSVFCWNGNDAIITARYVRIASNGDGTQDSVLELVFTDADGKMLLPANADEYQTLFDEQEFFTGRKTYQSGTYFDEIYHARTAYEMIHHLYCYENTHPPLGKIFIACGIMLFGMNPFGWRFMGTLFGVLMLPIFYLFAKKMFKETWISAVTTILFAFDFMHYVQTRIATIDVFVTLFIILAYFFMYCYTRKSFYDTRLRDTFIPLGLCGIAMGLSWACKWTGVYASAGLCVLFFATMLRRFREYSYAIKHPGQETAGISHRHITESFHKNFFKTIGFCCIFFVAVPAVIYVLSYIPFQDGTDHGLLQRVVDNAKNMFSYHSNLDSTHPYSSTWYEWPIMTRPIFYYSGETAAGLKEGISAFGNPLVWWMGIPAFLMVLYLAVMGGDRKCRFLSIAYLSQYLPWVFIGRIVFIYHYFPSVPFVVMMIGWCMKEITERKPKWKKAMYVYAGLTVLLFIVFYPVLTGTPVSGEYVKSYLKWFDSWVLVSL